MKKMRLALGIALGLVVFLWCQSVNFAGGFEGGRAGAWELGATAVYMGFWVGFSFLLRGEPGALWVCSGVALLTLLGSLSALVPIDFVPFSFLMVIFAGVPLYGLRFFMEWTGVYLLGGAGAAVWLACSVWMLKRQPGRGGKSKGREDV